MTREQLINEAVAKALGWKLDAVDSRWWVLSDGTFRYLPSRGFAWNDIHTYLFPEIEKRGKWDRLAENLDKHLTEDWAYHHVAGSEYSAGWMISPGDVLEIFVTKTPLEICEAFLRATGGWTKEMESNDVKSK